jgi:hypothetical protein
MAYYPEDKFSSNEVAGAIAAAAIHDLHVNSFTFNGFPGVDIERSPFGFTVHLTLGKTQSSPWHMSFTEGKALAYCFQKRQQIPSEKFLLVQNLLVEVEYRHEK